jgi:hypothetical protein
MQDRNIKMNKRGEGVNLLGEDVVKMIISIIGIAILVFLVYLIYQSATQNRRLEQAEMTLEGLTSTINSMEEIEVKNYAIESPKDWNIVYFQLDESSPNKCFGKDCLCICEGNSIEECNKGACSSFGNIIFYLGDDRKISLEDAPLEITINKNKNKITINKNE